MWKLMFLDFLLISLQQNSNDVESQQVIWITGYDSLGAKDVPRYARHTISFAPRSKRWFAPMNEL